MVHCVAVVKHQIQGSEFVGLTLVSTPRARFKVES